jgi:hypothetical protein
MYSEGRLFETMELANGLKIYFYDCSREAVADRWQVQLRIKIPMEVRQAYFQHHQNPAEAFETFTSSAGKTLYLELERVRNFIGGREVAATLEAFKAEFIQTNLNYIAGPNFPAKYILRRYTEWTERKDHL